VKNDYGVNRGEGPEWAGRAIGKEKKLNHRLPLSLQTSD
jgi:hypothetical protein